MVGIRSIIVRIAGSIIMALVMTVLLAVVYVVVWAIRAAILNIHQHSWRRKSMIIASVVVVVLVLLLMVLVVMGWWGCCVPVEVAPTFALVCGVALHAVLLLRSARVAAAAG